MRRAGLIAPHLIAPRCVPLGGSDSSAEIVAIGASRLDMARPLGTICLESGKVLDSSTRLQPGDTPKETNDASYYSFDLASSY